MSRYVEEFDDGPGGWMRAGRDYPIWPSSIAQGYVEIGRVAIEFAS